MSVGSVQGSNLVPNTAIAAGVGAGIAGGLNYGFQKTILKDPKTYIKGLRDSQDIWVKGLTESAKKNKVPKKELKEAIDTVKDSFKGPIKYAQDLAKSGKVNWKEVGKRAGVGAAVVVGVYLAYRGVKSLFSNKAE